MNRPRTVAFDAGRNTVVLIDQRRLPHRITFFRAKNFRETAKAIANMTVRGAGAIGATAAYGLAQGARAFRGSRLGEFRRHVDRVQLLEVKSRRRVDHDGTSARRCRTARRHVDHDVRLTLSSGFAVTPSPSSRTNPDPCRQMFLNAALRNRRWAG